MQGLHWHYQVVKMCTQGLRWHHEAIRKCTQGLCWHHQAVRKCTRPVLTPPSCQKVHKGPGQNMLWSAVTSNNMKLNMRKRNLLIQVMLSERSFMSSAMYKYASILWMPRTVVSFHPGRTIQTNHLNFSGKHSAMLQLMHKDSMQMSVYHYLFIHTEE